MKINHRHIIYASIMAFMVAETPAQSIRPGWGATPYGDTTGTGVTFRVWAPGASQVTVAGTFNSWNTTSIHLLREPGTNGVWSRDVPSARTGHNYKYLVDGRWKADPQGRAYDGGPTANTVVTDILPPVSDGFVAPPLEQMVIYELHIGTFCDLNPADAKPATFFDAIHCLDWVADMGFNAIQLLPVNEFPDEFSWGYNPVGLHAIESTYGGMTGLRAFISEAHQRGLAVLGDVVINHWGFTNTYQFDLYGFDTSSGAGSYFYAGAQQTTPWGPRPNYSQTVVANMIMDSVQILLDAGMDGIRWDSPIHIFRDQQGAIIPAATTLMKRAYSMLESNGALSIAENGRSILPAVFDSEWIYTNRNILLGDIANPFGRVWPRFQDALYATRPGDIIPLESHDTCGFLNANALRMPVWLAYDEPDNHERTKMRTMMATASMILSAGTPMLFMGTETGETERWHDDRPRAMVTNDISRFTRELIRLRRNLDGLSNGLTTTNIFVSNGVLPAGIQMRRGPTNDAVLVLFNTHYDFTYNRPTSFPTTGHWFCVLSSDDPRFGGQGRGTLHVELTTNSSTEIAIPPHGTMVFSRVLPAGDWDDDGLPNHWEFEHFGSPTNAMAGDDPDGDGMTNLEEWLAGTDPNDFESFLGITEIKLTPEGTQLIWRGNGEREYILSALSAGGTNWFPVSTSIYTLGFTHTNLINCPGGKEACIMFRVERSHETISIAE